MKSLLAAVLMLGASAATAAEPHIWGDEGCAMTLVEDAQGFEFGPTDGSAMTDCSGSTSADGRPALLTCQDGTKFNAEWMPNGDVKLDGALFRLSTDESGVCD